MPGKSTTITGKAFEIGGTVVVTIPKSVRDYLKISAGDKVEVTFKKEE